MNLKKFTTLLFVLLFATASVVFAANNTRNVYSVYSDNFNGAHFYGLDDNVPESDIDGIKFDVWADQWTPGGTMLSESVESTSGDPAPEGNKYMRYTWKQYTWAGCGYTRINKNVLYYGNGKFTGRLIICFQISRHIHEHFIYRINMDIFGSYVFQIYIVDVCTDFHVS